MMHRMLTLGVLVGVAVLLASGSAAMAADRKAPGPLGLPSVDTLKAKLTLTDEQVKKADEVYEDYKDKAKEAEKKGAEDVKAMRHEIIGKLKEMMSDEQKTKLDGLVSEKKEK
jgi:hypothetical protein